MDTSRCRRMEPRKYFAYSSSSSSQGVDAASGQSEVLSLCTNFDSSPTKTANRALLGYVADDEADVPSHVSESSSLVEPGSDVPNVEVSTVVMFSEPNAQEEEEGLGSSP